MYIHVCTPICTCTYTYVSLYTHSVSSLHHLLETIGTSQLCSGNADGHFLTLPNIQKGVLKDMSSEFHCKLIHVATLLNQTCNYFSPGSKVVAVVDSTRKGYPSIYHVDCEFLVAGQVERCSACSRHRKSLRTMASRSSRDDHTHPNSHTPYAALRRMSVSIAFIWKPRRQSFAWIDFEISLSLYLPSRVLLWMKR